MSTSPTDKRIDPLIDAYRQASDLDARTTGAGPSAALRAAVLAHARVVAPSAPIAEPKLAVNEAVLATPAANEPKPVWRMVAGVVLGLASMWVYQLTRPGTTGEANVAIMTAPQNAQSVATEAVKAASAGTAPDSPVAPAAPVMASAAAVGAPNASGSANTGAHAPQQTSVAIAALPRTASPALPAMTPMPSTAARETSPRERAGAVGNNASVDGSRDSLADAARSDTSIAMAKVDEAAKRAEQSAALAAAVAPISPAPSAPAATASTASTIPETNGSEPFREIVVASAEKRKATRQSETARPAGAGASAAAAPDAFPATASGAMVASLPPPAAPTAASPQSAIAGGSVAKRQGALSTPDAAMFSAIRIGNVNALRAALARGANVNTRDETGRSALQIARDRSDPEILKALDISGAK